MLFKGYGAKVGLGNMRVKAENRMLTIDHRTQSVFNGSRLGTNLSANALQEHFTLPYENEQPIPLTIPKEEDSGLEQELQGSGLFDEYGSGLRLMAGNGSSNEAQEAAFDRELRRKKKKRKGRNL